MTRGVGLPPDHRGGGELEVELSPWCQCLCDEVFTKVPRSGVGGRPGARETGGREAHPLSLLCAYIAHLAVPELHFLIN